MNVARAGSRGQATVEFALVAVLFFGLFFPIVDSGLWAIESDAAVGAAGRGTVIALGAAHDRGSLQTAERLVFPAVSGPLHAAMMGTAVEDWFEVNSQARWTGFVGCPKPADVADREGVGHVIVCALNDGVDHVTVSVAGYARSFVPPVFGLARSRAWGLPVGETATVPIGTFPG